MYEVEYNTTDHKLVTVIVGTQSKEEAIRLVKESDDTFDSVIYTRNLVGVVYFIDRSDRK